MYLLRLRTIPSIVTFLPTIIVLRTCYVDPFIAFGLLLLDNPSLWPTFLRGARTLLSLLNSTILVAFGLVFFGNKSHSWSTEHFQAFFLQCWISAKVFMCSE